MKLRDLFDRMGEMFRGQASTEETAQRIYGPEVGADGRRLALYNHVRGHRTDELRFVFPRCAAQIGDAWTELAYAYFVRHPWGGFDYLPHGGDFAAYLAEVAPANALPVWLPELAALEWAINRATWTADEPADPAVGPIRLAPSVVLHRFAHDVARWALRHEPRPPAPERRAVTVATWKPAVGLGRFGALDDVQLAVLAQIRAGELDPDQVPTGHAVTALALQAFVRAGVVVGDATGLITSLADPDLPPDTTSVGSNLSRRYGLAAFAQARWEDGALQLWSPVAAEVVATDDPALAIVAGQLAAPRAIGDVITALAGTLVPAQVVEIADALETSGLLVAADTAPHPAITAGWDPHEAAVYALARVPDATPPDRVPPAIRSLDESHPLVGLPPIDDRPIGDLAAILARRVTTRRFAARAIPIAVLARVLGLAARNRAGASGASHVTRPYPSAGARHSLEIYPVVRAGGVDELAAGIYRYRAESDQLERLSGDPDVAAACLRDAGFADADAPGVLLKIAARMGRAVQGPGGGSLPLVLQEVGCLVQTLYLAATALELGACAVTVTHDEAFAGLGLVEPWSEPMLGGVALGIPG